jgi:hypothetical protein
MMNEGTEIILQEQMLQAANAWWSWVSQINLESVPLSNKETPI